MKIETMAVVTLAFLSGCDFFNSTAKKVEIIRLEEQKAARVATEKKDAAAALKAYIEGKCKLVEGDGKVIASALAEIAADADKLEKAVQAILEGEQNAELSYEVRLLRTLKDDTVNALAQKYLAGGFSLQRESFVARVREAREKDAEYRKAVQKSDAAFDAKIGSSGNWSGSSKEQRETEIKRLQREIADLEKRRTETRRGLVGSRSQERERAEKMGDYEREIRRKREQIDVLRDPNAARRIEERAVSEQQQVHDRAMYTKRQEMNDIDRRLKPTVTVLDVTREVEKETIGKLRSEMRMRKEKLTARNDELSKRVRLAKEMLLEIPVCDGEDLKKLRLRADRQLSAETAK